MISILIYVYWKIENFLDFEFIINDIIWLRMCRCILDVVKFWRFVYIVRYYKDIYFDKINILVLEFILLFDVVLK